jgi:hypothetical protein
MKWVSQRCAHVRAGVRACGLTKTNNPKRNIIKIFAEKGGVELAAKELAREPARYMVSRVLLTIAWVGTNEEVAPRVVASGIHKTCIKLITTRTGDFDTAMSLVRTLTAAPACRAQLRVDGLLDAVIPYLDGLKSVSESELRGGFRAGSIIARLAGNDETGVGPQLLRNNPLLIIKTVDIFDHVLDAGAGGSYMNMKINPHLITMDVRSVRSGKWQLLTRASRMETSSWSYPRPT